MALIRDVRGAAAAERSDLHSLLRELTEDQWEAPSLCDAWSVRDVAVHVVSYDALSWRELAAAFLRGGLNPDRINAQVLDRYTGLSIHEVLGLLQRHIQPRGLTAALGGGIALTDGLIHHQDVRRALDLPREVPHDRLSAALSFALRAPTLPARANARGLRLVATDLTWTHGDGPEVRGPGEALLMACAGRLRAVDDLQGDGAATLRSRVTGQQPWDSGLTAAYAGTARSAAP